MKRRSNVQSKIKNKIRIKKDEARPVLDIRGLVVHRDGTLILDRLDWRVERGEHWVILGANGSGKTSLLSALTGYLTPSAGEIELLGETYGNSDWRELRQRVGLVSSAIRQKVPDWDPAGLVVIGGKYAMLDYWGRVTPSGRAQKILTSANLTQTFSSPLRLRRRDGRWALHRVR